MLERELEAWCRKQAGVAGCLLLKWTSPGTAGVPDRILIGPGGVIFVEFKRPGGKVTKLQAAVMRRIERSGGHCYVCDSKEKFLQTLSRVSVGGD